MAGSPARGLQLAPGTPREEAWRLWWAADEAGVAAQALVFMGKHERRNLLSAEAIAAAVLERLAGEET